MIIKPNNRYMQRFDRLARILPAGMFVLVGGGILFYTILNAITNPGSETAWSGALVSVALIALLSFLLKIMMSKRGFARMLEKISTQLTPDTIIFSNPYFSTVELGWNDITDIRLSEVRGSEGIYFKLAEGSQTLQDFADLLLRGRDLERAQGYQWRMTPDLYDRAATELYALFARFWREPHSRIELAEEIRQEVTH